MRSAFPQCADKHGEARFARFNPHPRAGSPSSWSRTAAH